MGKIKEQKNETKEYELTEREWNYVKLLNVFLNYNTEKNRLISGFLYYLCNTRFNYPETVNLVFETDLDDDKRILKVKEIPNEVIEKATAKN